MVFRKQGKRRRGERSYHGSHKKWRGGGSRGGRGRAGMMKHKKSWMIQNEPDHFGRTGFKPRETFVEFRTINVETLDKIADRLVEQKLAERENDKIKINLPKIGYEKVLGNGRATRPLVIEAKYFSKGAIEKIEGAGGKAVKL